MPFRVEFHVKTDVGIQRSRNEDSYLVDNEHRLCVVADGMGGHLGGDIASELATTTLREFFHIELTGNAKPRKQNPKSDSDLLKRAIGLANTNVFEQGNTNEHLRDMGTTLVAAWFREDHVIYASVGDSRIYRLRDDELKQVSVDHSWVGELLRRRLITEVEAANHPLKNIITRALGMDRKVVVDTFIDEIEADDLYLLCTDGLTDFVDDNRLREMLVEHGGDLKLCAEKLIDLANFIAGADNTTVGLARVRADSPA